MVPLVKDNNPLVTQLSEWHNPEPGVSVNLIFNMQNTTYLVLKGHLKI